MASANKNYMLNDKFPKQIKNATSTSDGLMSSEDKVRLDGLFEFGLFAPATPDKNGLMSSIDKTKLDGIEEGANYYIHPDDETTRHVSDEQMTRWASQVSVFDTLVERDNYIIDNPDTECIISFVKEEEKGYQYINGIWKELGSDSIKFVVYDGLDSDSAIDALSANQGKVLNGTITAHIADKVVHITEEERTAWNAKASTALATQTDNGLMSKSDKTKLDGIATGANNYTHPVTHDATIIVEDITHRFVTDDEKATWNAKASTTVATTTTNGLMASTDKSKLDGVADNANNYTHPVNHPATMITEDTTHRFVTDTEKSTWNAKANTDVVTQTANGLMSFEDKLKLDGIREGAGTDEYVHPATHPATMITEDTTHRFVTDTEKSTWNSKASTAVVTQTANGLMIASDKVKLDGIATNANNYTHPATHPATMIVEDDEHMFITKAQLDSLNALIAQVNTMDAKLKTAVFYG